MVKRRQVYCPHAVGRNREPAGVFVGEKRDRAAEAFRRLARTGTGRAAPAILTRGGDSEASGDVLTRCVGSGVACRRKPTPSGHRPRRPPSSGVFLPLTLGQTGHG